MPSITSYFFFNFLFLRYIFTFLCNIFKDSANNPISSNSNKETHAINRLFHLENELITS